ncbi:MAG: 50S ribosomal protein L24 [Clostridia bacterium]|nr:50S ribosomal protein L24 [Clostridia bacterium]
MKVKIGDNVKILAGKDRGKEGKVLKTLKKKDKVVVEGINIVKKHSKPNNTNDKGGIFSVEAPIHVSNVKVVEATKTAKKADKKEEKVEKVEKEAKATKTTKTTKKASK